MQQDRPRTIVITGCSSGIGFGAAQAFVRRDYRVFGSVRSEDGASKLRDTLGAKFTPLVFDVRDPEAIRNAVSQVREELHGDGLGGLINNAGIAVGGPLLFQPLDIVKDHFDVNVLGTIAVTQAFVPLLRESRPQPGRILNVSSLGGKVAGPFTGAYHGTKYATEGISHTLRRELSVYGIDVIIVAPASIDTPIWVKGLDAERYRNTPYYDAILEYVRSVESDRKKMMTVERVCERIADIVEVRKPRTRYTISSSRFRDWLLANILPDRLLDRFVRKQFKLPKY